MVQISRGFDFPTIWGVEEPDRCIKYLDRYVLEGRIIMVEKASNGALSIELATNNSKMRIIHRKVALILGQWVSEKEAVMLYLLQQNWWKKSKSLIQSVQI
ncbi:hypothetical protein OROMI_001370 [Orobanche minor]